MYHLAHTSENVKTQATRCEGSRLATDGRTYEQVAAIQTVQAHLLPACLPACLPGWLAVAYKNDIVPILGGDVMKTLHLVNGAVLGAGDDRWDGCGNMLRHPRPARPPTDLSSAQVSAELKLNRANTAAPAWDVSDLCVSVPQSFVTPPHNPPQHHACPPLNFDVPSGRLVHSVACNSLSQASQSASTLASQLASQPARVPHSLPRCHPITGELTACQRPVSVGDVSLPVCQQSTSLHGKKQRRRRRRSLVP